MKVTLLKSATQIESSNLVERPRDDLERNAAILTAVSQDNRKMAGMVLATGVDVDRMVVPWCWVSYWVSG